MALDDIMDVYFEVIMTFLVCVFAWVMNAIVKRARRKLPPGPFGLPIVGYLPFLTKHVHLKFIELGKTYGDIFSIRLGSVTVVVLNRAEDIREAFAKPELLARPPHTTFSIFNEKSPFVSGGTNIWKDQRRFVVQSLKDLGLGRTKFEGQIQKEIDNFLDFLESHNGEAIDPSESLSSSMSNNICALTFGKRYEYDDPERKFLDKCLSDEIKIIAQTAPHIFFSWIRHFPFILKWLKYDEGVLAFQRTHSIFRKKIEDHKKTLDPYNIRDLIDGYLVEMKYRQENHSDTSFNEDMLEGCIGNLFGAGTESVRTTISWCVYTMAAYQDIQTKVHQEISEVLGNERDPVYNDQKIMPYAHAVILEVMRWKTIVPLNVPRYATADTVIGKYEIPQGTTILANFWAAHHDPKQWEEPEKFLPKRFLESDEKYVRKHSSFVPFSVGKRACPGETMAYIEIFLYFVSILRKFQIKFPDGMKPTFDAELSVSYRLKPFLIRFIEKN